MSGSQEDDAVRVMYKGATYKVPMHFITCEHPGGPEAILEHANTDITEVFTEIHPGSAEAVLLAWRDVPAGAPTQEVDEEKEEELRRQRIGETVAWRGRNMLLAVGGAVAVMALVALRLRRSRAS